MAQGEQTHMFNRFGTTQEMMIQTVQEAGTEMVLAIDSRGLYLTSAQFVGRPIADRNRYSGARQGAEQRIAALGLMWRACWQPTSTVFRLKPYLPKRSIRSRRPSAVPRANWPTSVFVAIAFCYTCGRRLRPGTSPVAQPAAAVW